MQPTEDLRDPLWMRQRLREGLLGELPGVEAQLLMSPRPRHGWVPGNIPEGLRQAAALVLVYEKDGIPSLVLTQRRADLSAHPGQVSLPGGSIDPGEEPADAALREAEEEIGVDAAKLAVIGALTPLHIPASGFLLHPFIATTGAIGPMVVSDAEVARALEVPLHALASPSRLRLDEWTLRGNPTRVPSFRVDDLPVWGATAMVLAELLAILGHPPDPWSPTVAPTAGGNLTLD